MGISYLIDRFESLNLLKESHYMALSFFEIIYDFLKKCVEIIYDLIYDLDIRKINHFLIKINLD